MTDNSGARGWRLPRVQAWQGVLAGGLSVLVAATVTLVARPSDPASADTHLASVRNAVIRLADGTLQPAEAGAQLPEGAQLRTGQDGGAQLVTAGRSVYLGALTTVLVVDGVRQELERGQVMVDARKGAALDLTTRAGTVAAPAGALVRVETAAVLRLGVFEGTSTITAAGRHASTKVTALHQVQVPYGYLSGQVTPLALTDDAWESRLAYSLVSADQDLRHLADSLGGPDGMTLLTAVPASWRSVVPAAGAARGEEALSVALAQAAGPDPAKTLLEVRGDRSDGGSWGVVAALVGARVSAVSALLDRALAPATPPPTLVAVPPLTDLPGLLSPDRVVPAPTPATTPATARPTARPRVSKPPAVTPTTPPPPATLPPAPPPPGLVGGLLNAVLGLLQPPTASAQPAASPSPLLSLNLSLLH